MTRNMHYQVLKSFAESMSECVRNCGTNRAMMQRKSVFTAVNLLGDGLLNGVPWLI